MTDDPTPQVDPFAAAAERRRVADAQLSERPVEDVLGLVDARGAVGWSSKDGRWTLSFDFDRWKIPPGPMKTRGLSIRFRTSQEEFDTLQRRIEPDSVVRIRARVVEESAFGTAEAELVELLGPDRSDPELNQAAADLQTPVLLEDRRFGTLTLDRSLNWYTGGAKWNGEAVGLNLDAEGAGGIDGALAVARSLWEDQQRWTQRIEDYAVQELLPLKNENWLDEGEAELTARQFQSRMTLKSITVNSDGSFDFLHDDGDLFGGHSIQVGGDLSRGPTYADIPG
ncbi:DUF2262 domain-containing protein [Paludisphaera mucosa]|uniref:DUF2262 domain-containing protein n=1 Tax=Paludisphaera mucosa TaxID=3030827 RepID=A0ABT6FI90_9BACT|nr:DUF2262 domain-containing protein [Paludisphaera mucosa]MDG3007298.1 DUF2262 domain-containing protein [Paludisphaera mucosa]